MREYRRYWHMWLCDEDKDSFEFDIVIASEKDGFWEPGYEEIIESEYLVNGEEVTYDEFVERTGYNQADMSNETLRINL